MRKHFIMALAALGFAACSESVDDPNVQGGEIEESYIAINLMAADANTRKATDSYGYEYGTDAERAIKTAYFFFFDENGNPFNVTGAPATAPGGGQNHLSLTIEEASTDDDPNVSDIKNAVLILNTYKGIYPKQIVAVLNWTPVQNKAYTLNELHGIYASLGNEKDGYVMSNSVYMRDNKIVDAVPLTETNIKQSSQEALNNPIDIYVERTAAKVVLTANNGTIVNNSVVFNTQIPSSFVSLNQETPVYVKLYGWELYNDYGTTNLLKNIRTDWSVDNLGLTWNDIPFFRCYWAESQSTGLSDKFSWNYSDEDKNAKGFQTNYGFAIASQNDEYQTRSTYTYCGENTNGEALRTKVILKGQLVTKTNETTYTTLTLARWYGNDYAGIDNLKTAVANSLAYTLFYSYIDNGETKYHSIEPTDIEIVDNIEGLKEYQVGFQLSTNAEEKNWFLYSSQDNYTPMADITDRVNMKKNTNEHLANIEPALLYNDGQTYYIVDIEHLGADGKTAQYGVVRNHVYQIDIQSIKGYGSPVYNGFGNLENPEYPEIYNDTYVAARINVLSWKVVKQGVDIVQ